MNARSVAAQTRSAMRPPSPALVEAGREDVIDIRSVTATAPSLVAVLGLGYVGLPTAMALGLAGHDVIGIDPDVSRLECIRAGTFDGSEPQRSSVGWLLAEGTFELAVDARCLASAGGVVICVPTPVDHDRVPDLRALHRACTSVVDAARAGQTIVLTSTTYPGCTRDLLVRPLEDRGLRVGVDVHVAFSPERIDPGNAVYAPSMVPRVIGGHTPACTAAASALLGPTAGSLHQVTSTEVAEFTKLFENVFRAVNIALANELSDTAEAFGLDPAAVIDAAATKPYGFMRFDPGPGVGGHCIPVDPHYLLDRSAATGVDLPLVRRAMQQIDERPGAVVRRVLAELDCVSGRRPHVLVVGVAYKAGVADVRESPSIVIMRQLDSAGVAVSCHDPLVPGDLELPGGVDMVAGVPAASEFDVCLVLTVHPGVDYSWLSAAATVVDMTFGRHGTHGATCL